MVASIVVGRGPLYPVEPVLMTIHGWLFGNFIAFCHICGKDDTFSSFLRIHQSFVFPSGPAMHFALR